MRLDERWESITPSVAAAMSKSYWPRSYEEWIWRNAHYRHRHFLIAKASHKFHEPMPGESISLRNDQAMTGSPWANLGEYSPRMHSLDIMYIFHELLITLRNDIIIAWRQWYTANYVIHRAYINLHYREIYRAEGMVALLIRIIHVGPAMKTDNFPIYLAWSSAMAQVISIGTFSYFIHTKMPGIMMARRLASKHQREYPWINESVYNRRGISAWRCHYQILYSPI